MNKKILIKIVLAISLLFLMLSLLKAEDSEFGNNCMKLINKEDKDPSIRLLATLALEKTGNPKAVPFIILALEDDSYSYRLAGIHALGILGGKESLDYLKKYWSMLEDLMWRKSRKIDNLTYKIEKAYVAAALYKLGEDSHVDYLYNAIKTKEKVLKYSVSMSLGLVNNNKSKEILYNILLTDRLDLPRCGAASALVELKDEKIISTLKNLMEKGQSAPCFEIFLKKNVK